MVKVVNWVLVLSLTLASSLIGAANTFEGMKAQALRDLKRLSSDDMAGRKPQTPGHEQAVAYISSRFAELKLQSFQPNYVHPFDYRVGLSKKIGQNIVGWIPGRDSESFIVVTAHYDHLGTKSGLIFNGADDNASGVAAMLALAHYFRQHRPQHSIVFVATDAEEDGLKGARAFLERPTIAKSAIVMNLNLDMLGHPGHRRALFVSGARRQAALKQLVLVSAEKLETSAFRLKLGHDRISTRLSSRPESKIDWLRSSDHWPFIQNKIPYLYFGVDTHKHYHKTTDDFEQIDQAFFLRAIEAVIMVSRQVDRLNLATLPN